MLEAEALISARFRSVQSCWWGHPRPPHRMKWRLIGGPNELHLSHYNRVVHIASPAIATGPGGRRDVG